MRTFYFSLAVLLASASAAGQTTILSENFNATAAGWTRINNSTGGTLTEADWSLRADGYIYSSVFVDNEIFHSNDNSQFILTNSDAQGGDVTSTILQSPSISTSGYSSVTLQFYHHFREYQTDTGYVEVSTNGTTWITVASLYAAPEDSIGAAKSFVQQSINLNAYTGNSTVNIRFRYHADFGYYWAIDNVTITGTPIITPVTLLTFSGYRENNHNVLKWSTASEQINKGFQIERSINGISYSSIGFVNSKAQNGNSSSLLQYSFNDNNVSGNKQYYRLRQIDIDNHEKMSNIIVIKSQRPTSLHLDGLFPNPAKNIVNAIVDVPTGDLVDLMIIDMNGKLIKRQSSSVDAGTNTIPIDISRLPGGVYSIKILSKSNNEIATEKFMKQ